MTDIGPLSNIRRDLHRIPEIGYREYKTQQYLLDYIKSLPAGHLDVKTWETGIFVRVRGTAPEKTIGYRADIDGLPIKEETGLPFASEHHGYMHACGHDFHMTIALGLLTHFACHPLQDNLLFIFQPAEEGPGGAERMLNSEIMKEWKPDMLAALHIAPEYPAGAMAVKEGLLFANTSELFINLKGKGGHAAYPHLTNDMVVAACSLVGQLQTVVSRNVNPLDSAVITIGKITGGDVQNIIAENARLEGTIRTLNAESMGRVKKRIEELVEGTRAGFACEASIDYGCMYYQVDNNPDLTREFIEFVKEDGSLPFIPCTEAMTGEDFGYMLKEIPGFMFWLGVGSPYGLHHSKLSPDEQAIEKAVPLLIKYLTYKGTNE